MFFAAAIFAVMDAYYASTEAFFAVGLKLRPRFANAVLLANAVDAACLRDR